MIPADSGGCEVSQRDCSGSSSNFSGKTDLYEKNANQIFGKTNFGIGNPAREQQFWRLFPANQFRYKRVEAFETALEGSLPKIRDERCKQANIKYKMKLWSEIYTLNGAFYSGVSISSGNSLRVISIFDYTTIVVYDGLMRVTDVGTIVGDIGIWEVGSREKLVLKNFKVNYLSAVSISQQFPRPLRATQKELERGTPRWCGFVLGVNLDDQIVTVNGPMVSNCENRVQNSSLTASIDLGIPFLFSKSHNKLIVGCGNGVILECRSALMGCSTASINDTVRVLERHAGDGGCGSAFLMDQVSYIQGIVAPQSVPLSLVKILTLVVHANYRNSLTLYRLE
ncbi:hypothetical protein Tco_1575611 [Tanacetum coccineum]